MGPESWPSGQNCDSQGHQVEAGSPAKLTVADDLEWAIDDVLEQAFHLGAVEGGAFNVPAAAGVHQECHNARQVGIALPSLLHCHLLH